MEAVVIVPSAATGGEGSPGPGVDIAFPTPGFFFVPTPQKKHSMLKLSTPGGVGTSARMSPPSTCRHRRWRARGVTRWRQADGGHGHYMDAVIVGVGVDDRSQ